jgi:hypothetical protein
MADALASWSGYQHVFSKKTTPQRSYAVNIQTPNLLKSDSIEL